MIPNEKLVYSCQSCLLRFGLFAGYNIVDGKAEYIDMQTIPSVSCPRCGNVAIPKEEE